MPVTADRYLRTGPIEVPQIYHGDLKGISLALGDVERMSRIIPGVHMLEAVYGRERVPFRVYEGGVCTYQAEQPVS
jgi:hypothetical protein